jgi:hypothetical protein
VVSVDKAWPVDEDDGVVCTGPLYSEGGFPYPPSDSEKTYPPRVLVSMEIELSVKAWAWWWNCVCDGEPRSNVIPDSATSEMVMVEITDVPENDPLQELDWSVPPNALVVGDSVVIENNGVAVVLTDNVKQELLNAGKVQAVLAEGAGRTD